MSAEPTTTWFPATSGRVSGTVGLIVAVVMMVLTLIGRADPALAIVALLIALLSWMVLLRPRVGVRGHDLLLRGMASTLAIPLASVGTISARQVLAVRVGDRRYVSAAVGQSLGQLHRERRVVRHHDAPAPTPHRGATDHIVELIETHVADARREAAPTGEVRREWAWPEVGALAALAVALVVAVLV